SDVTKRPASRNLRTSEPRSPALPSGVSWIAPGGTLSDDAERTVKSSSRVRVPAGSACAATRYPTVTGAGALSASAADLGRSTLYATSPSATVARKNTMMTERRKLVDIVRVRG